MTPAHTAKVDDIINAFTDTTTQRWLKRFLRFSHQPSFPERLRELTKRAGPTFQVATSKRGRWEQMVVDGRNGLADRTRRIRTRIRVYEQYS